MRQMLKYRTFFLAKTWIGSGILMMELRSIPHQSLVKSISALMTSSPQWLYVYTLFRSHALQTTFALSKRVELPLSRSETLTWQLISNPTMPSDELSNRQSVNTGLRSNHTTPAPMHIRCGRACKLLPNTKRKHSWELPSDKSLPNELNNFYARFKESNTADA